MNSGVSSWSWDLVVVGVSGSSIMSSSSMGVKVAMAVPLGMLMTCFVLLQTITGTCDACVVDAVETTWMPSCNVAFSIVPWRPDWRTIFDGRRPAMIAVD